MTTKIWVTKIWLDEVVEYPTRTWGQADTGNTWTAVQVAEFTMAEPTNYLDWLRDPPPKPNLEPPAVTSALFENAIEIINTHGWIQWQGSNLKGVCAIYAISSSISDLHAGQVRWGEMLGIRQWEIMDLMGLDRGEWPSIPYWNDWPGRTKGEVLDALMLAAKKLRDMGR